MAAIKTITIRRKLESDTIELGKEAKDFLGKNVEIVIRELADPKPVEKNGAL